MYDAFGGVHPVYMSKRVTPRFKPKPRFRVTYLRAWREKAGKTLEQAAEVAGMTHAQLSRIERGQQGYKQPMLEALADYYRTDTASLIMRDPNDPDGIWSVWDQAKPGERQMIVDLAKTVIKTGT